MARLLSNIEIDAALKSLPQWRVIREKLSRRYVCDDFVHVMRFVNLIAKEAERANHHPDISINYNKVTFALTTHDDGGITEKDLSLARSIEGAAKGAGAR